jgi:hypothetical protein
MAGRGGFEIHSLPTLDFHTTELDLGLNLTDFPQQKDSKILSALWCSGSRLPLKMTICKEVN